MKYEDIVDRWEHATLPTRIFSGHLLTVLTSEISRIEGIDISYHRTKELFENEYVAGYTGDIRDLFSVMNTKYLAEFYNDSLILKRKVTPWFVKETHRILLKAAIDNHRYHDNCERAGEYKKHDYCVGRGEVGAYPEDVEQEIIELCDLIETSKCKDTLKKASAFHCIFESIHPFADGNGRAGRWLLNYYLVLNNHPPVVIKNADREDYYKALEDYDSTDSPAAMYEYLKGQVVKNYSAIRYLLEDTSKVDELWNRLPPAIRENYEGDREVLLHEMGLI